MVRLTRICAGLAAACALALMGQPAAAAPGLSPPYVVANNVSCFGLAGDTIAWEEVGHHRRLEELPQAARIALLGPVGALSTTTAPAPGPGTLFCDPAASTSSGAQVYALPAGRTPHSVPYREAPLWLARPGAPAEPLGVRGIEPTVALAPDGSGVVAWLAEAGPKPLPTYEGEDPRSGPSFIVRAARLQPDGSIGPAQTIGGPSGAYEAIPEDEFPDGPVAQALPGGSLAVAWALLGGTPHNDAVGVAEAGPGGAFAAPVTLLGPSTPNREGLPEDQLQLAAGGGRLIAQWQIGFEHLIESASQASFGAPFLAAPRLAPLGSESPELVATAADAAGNTLTVLDSRSGSAVGALAVERRATDGSELRETIVPAGSEAEVPSLAVAPDGSAAVAWLQPKTARDGGRTERAMLALAPPGGPFGAPEALTGLAPEAGRPAVAYDATGALHVAWTAGTGALSRPLFAAGAANGAPDPLASPGPKLALRSARLLGTSVLVTVRVDRPCLVRVQGVPIPFRRARESSQFPSWGASRYAARAGKVRLRIELPDNLWPGRASPTAPSCGWSRLRARPRAPARGYRAWFACRDSPAEPGLLQLRQERDDRVELRPGQVLERGHRRHRLDQRPRDRRFRQPVGYFCQVRARPVVALVADLVTGEAAAVRDRLLPGFVLSQLAPSRLRDPRRRRDHRPERASHRYQLRLL